MLSKHEYELPRWKCKLISSSGLGFGAGNANDENNTSKACKRKQLLENENLINSIIIVTYLE